MRVHTLSEVRVGLVPLRRVTRGLVDAWRGLASRALEPNPFHEPDFVLPALRHLAKGKGISLLVVTRGDEIDALMAVQRFKATRYSPPLPTLSIWSHPYQFLGTPLLDASRAEEALAVVLDPPLAVRGAGLFFSARWLSDDGLFGEALENVLNQRSRTLYRWTTGARAVLARSNGGTVKSGRYKRVREYRRSLERQVGWVRVVDRSRESEAVEDFLSLEAAGWKGREGTAMACQSSHAEFFRDVCARFANTGNLQLISLETPQGPLAMQCNFRAGEGMFHFKSAYDENFGHYRPGVQLLLEITESFEDAPFEFIDSCTDPQNELFNQMWPARRRVSTIIVPLDNHLSTASVSVMSKLRKAPG